MAPFVRVTFADFWMADQFNSLTTLFSDIVFFVCFYMNFYSSNILDDTGLFCCAHFGCQINAILSL